MLALGAATLQAATFTVLNTGDAGADTLRDAVTQANADPDADIIVFDPSLTTDVVAEIILSSGEMIIDSDLTITGPGAELLTVNGDNTSRIFTVNGGRTVTISGLTLTGGVTPQFEIFGGGGAIRNGGTLTISRAVLTGNTTASNGFMMSGGGAIYNGGTLTISESTLSGNSTGSSNRGGGAIFNNHNSTVTISASTLSENFTGPNGQGGAIYTLSVLTIIESTLSGNFTDSGGNDNGAAIGTYAGADIKIINSTLSGNTDNSVGSRSSAILNLYGTLVITQSTITGNVPAGISTEAGGNPATTILANSIIAGNGTADLVQSGSVTFTSNGANFIGVPDVSVTLAQTDKTFASTNTTLEQVLDPVLADNGGPTQTHALVPESPALNAGIDADALDADTLPLTNDQRGATFVRMSGIVDIGAFEADEVIPLAPEIVIEQPVDSELVDPAVAFGDQSVGFTSEVKTFKIKNTGNAALSVTSVSVTGDNADEFTVNTDGMLDSVPETTGETTFTVTFTPSSSGEKTATLTVLSDDAYEGTYDIALTGNGVQLPAVSGFTTGTKLIDLDVLANIDGVNRSTAVFTFPTPPQFGTVRIVGGKIRYIPTGALPLEGDSFTYAFDDGHGRIGTGTVTIANFANIAGEYDGLISPEVPQITLLNIASNGATHHRQSGHLRMSLSRTGAFTGTLTFAGTLLNQVGQISSSTYAFMGVLDSAGKIVRTIQRRGLPPIVFTLHFDAESGVIAGTAESTDGTTAFTSETTLARRTAAGSVAGIYTLQIEPDGTPGAPTGTGIAIAKVAAGGNVIIAGRLADGKTFSTVAFLHPDESFPLYAVLYNGTTEMRGSLRGVVQLPVLIQFMSAGPGTLEWFKPARPLDTLHPDGFTMNPTVSFVQ